MTKRSKKKHLPKKKAVTQPVSDMPSWWTAKRLHLMGIFLLAVLLYANTLTHDYTQDDAIVIYENEFTTQGLAGIPDILKYDTFRGFFKEEGKDQLVAGGRYRPLTLVMFAAEVELFGQSPLVGHLINILLYGLVGVLLYLVLLQFGVAANDRARWWASDISQVYFLAVVTTILFVAHPIHTEAVANIKGRDEIVTLLGSLAAIYLSFKAFYSRRPLLHLAVGTIFFLALLSKENAITFLAVAPLSYYIFTQAKLPKIISQTIPFILGAVLFLILRSSIVPLELGGEPTLELMNNPFVKVENGQYTHFTSGEKWATIFYTLGHYLQLLVFPHPLTHDYYPRHIDIVGFAHPKVLLSMLVYAALAVYAVVGLLRKDILSYGILFYLATLSIASNIVFPIGTTMSERFAFMPSIGYCWVVAVLLQRWGRSRVQQGKKNDWAAMRLPLLLVGAMTLLFSIKTISRNTVWKNNYTLFTTDVHTSVNSAKLRNAAAGETINAATNEANKSRQQQMYREAEEHLQMAIRIHPNYKNAYLQLGNVNNYLNQYEAAIEYYNTALQIDPNYQDAINNIGITYRDAGRYYGEEKQDLNNALKYLQLAYQYRPKEYETLRLLGIAHAIKGDTQRAISFFQQAVDLQPQNADALYNLGSAYYNAGNAAQGQVIHERALQIDPEVIERNQKR